MIIAATLGLAVLTSQVGEPVRARAILPNGSAIVAEQLVGSKTTSAVLFCRANGLADTPETHGYRHLVEHLCLSREGLDERLEAEGIFVTGQTGRDAMLIQASGPAAKYKEILAAFAEIAAPLEVTPAQIVREAGSIQEEIALVSPALSLNAEAWRTGFGPAGLDPAGSPDLLKTAEPGTISDLHRRSFAAGQLILVMVGPQSPNELLERARGWMGGLPVSDRTPLRRERATASRSETETVFGEARSAPCGPFTSSQTLATIAAGLVYATHFSDGFLIYTPTGTQSLVTVGRTQSNSGMSLFIDDLPADEARGYFNLGRSLLGSWLDRQRRDPLSRATFLGQSMLENIGGDLSLPEQQARTISPAEFNLGMRAFSRESAITVVGTKRP